MIGSIRPYEGILQVFVEGQLAKLAVGFLVVLLVVGLFFGIGLAMAVYRARTGQPPATEHGYEQCPSKAPDSAGDTNA